MIIQAKIISTPGYTCISDEYMLNESTGELVSWDWAQIPKGGEIKTPEVVELEKAREIAAAMARQNNNITMEQKKQNYYRRLDNKPLGEFCFINADNQYKDISPQSLTRLVYLATYLKYDNDILYKSGNKPMTKKDMEKILKISRNTFTRFWDEVSGTYLIETKIGIKLCDSFSRGKVKRQKKHGYTALQKIYIKRVRELYETTPISKHKHLGYVFQMLPYINVEFNVLCKNPEATELTDIEYMTMDEFCIACGVSPDKRARFIKSYSEIKLPVDDHEERFCSFVNDGVHIDTSKIFINPRVMYNGHDWERVSILASLRIE